MLCLTVICSDPEMAVKATEALSRTQLGLGLDDMSTTLSITPVDLETVEQEQPEV